MAADFLKLARTDPDATEVNELINATRDLRSVYERLERIRAKMRHNFTDTGDAATIDWAQVEGLWGIPAGNTSVGTTSNGLRVFTLIDGATGSMEGSFQTSAAKDLTETVG